MRKFAEHVNYIGGDDENPVVFTFEKESKDTKEKKAIIRTKQVVQMICCLNCLLIYLYTGHEVIHGSWISLQFLQEDD